MARTIQKKNNFNHGMTTKELVERTDLDIFNKSAEKLLNMTPIIADYIWGGAQPSWYRICIKIVVHCANAGHRYRDIAIRKRQ